MYLDYSKIKSANREQPQLRLRNLSDSDLGVIPFAHDLTMKINYTDVSEISFVVPYQVKGMINPLYAALSSYKIVYTEDLGIYVLMSPVKNGDGINEEKTVNGYSLEYLFSTKTLFLEEGTYNFWNPVNSADTILGRIIELDPTWRVGYVAPRLISCYRTFDQYDSDALSFLYSDAMEKYRCAIVFDVYKKTINAYDANEDADTIPIYLNYQNLVDTIQVEELTDELATKMHIYGADDLSIRDVNPIGTDYIVDLSYFISNGDLDVKVGSSNMTLADRVRAWQFDILSKQQYYMGLTASRASLTAQKLSSEADLTDLQGELDSLVSQQNVNIQSSAMEVTEAGKQYQQQQLNDINAKITSKKQEISSKQSEIDSISSELDRYTTGIQDIVNQLSFNKYFTDAERKILNQYLIEGSIDEETFVATDVSTTVSGTVSKVSGAVSISQSKLVKVDLSDFQKVMYTIAGGFLSIPNVGITADVIRGTLETQNNNDFTLTAYLGATKYSSHEFKTGMLTMDGKLSQFSSDISAQTDNEVTEYKGTSLSFNTSDANSYFTVSMNEFQKYSVQKDLYDFGSEALSDYAWPVYEFSINSANFLYHEKFEPYKNRLELGKAVYLELGSEGVLNAKIIGIELDFENITNFNLVFSNRYRLKNGVESWAEEIRSVSMSSRSFDASKYIYNRTADKATDVDIFMDNLKKGAADAILSAKDQKVVFDSNGIFVGGNSNYQLRMVDNMIAMSDDGFKTAKLAIGLFATPETGVQWGVNADLIAGNLILGNSCVLQNPLVDENGNRTGTMMFQVDSTGAWLYNSRIVFQNDNGLIIIDPDYGIVAGTKLLFDTNGTTVTPEFMDEAKQITFDADGMPKNANFFLDINDGNAYFRGKVIAKSGKIGGFDIEEDYLHSGSGSTYVALNGSGSNKDSLYAIWVGANNPSSAKFWVKKDGSISAIDAYFRGIVGGTTIIQGTLEGDPDYDSWLLGCGIRVGGNYKTGNGNFYVDPDGNVIMKGSINLQGNITWGSNSSPIRVLYSRTYLATPTSSYANYPTTSTTGWHRNLNVLNDLYSSYSYDGGKTWNAPMKMRGEDGKNGKDGTDATVTRGNIAKALFEGSGDYYQDGIYSYQRGSRYYIAINASYILAGNIDADEIALTCSHGGFCKGYGSNGARRTYGAMMYGSRGKDVEPYFIVTELGCRMSAQNDHDFYVVDNGVYASEAPRVRSDRRLKKDINYDMDKYKDFYMSLKPSFYKMKNGTSGRFHTGFIAQDVEDALKNSGLTTKDFSGISITPVQEVNERDGIKDVYYRLAYEDFISLNTFMIQSLVKEVQSLKDEIYKMKR